MLREPGQPRVPAGRWGPLGGAFEACQRPASVQMAMRLFEDAAVARLELPPPGRQAAARRRCGAPPARACARTRSAAPRGGVRARAGQVAAAQQQKMQQQRAQLRRVTVVAGARAAPGGHGRCRPEQAGARAWIEEAGFAELGLNR